MAGTKVDCEQDDNNCGAAGDSKPSPIPVFAPMSVPLSRRKQTLAVLAFALLLPISFIYSLWLLFVPILWIVTIPYFSYCMFDQAHVHGADNRRSDWLRRMSWWTHFRDYFPLTLQRMCELDPNKCYVFGYHPHGIISVGAFGNFATEATGFSDLFPGIKLRLLTLAMNFRIPFVRDLLLGLGICSVSAESCNYVLRKGAGNAIMIVVGGAAEALDARPGVTELVLAERKGFVKIALRNGASLVPVFSFGETDIFDQVENVKGSKLRVFQSWCQKMLGFSIPLFYGRGVFNYYMGLLPNRRPIHTVVGLPIDCPKLENPTDAQVTEFHNLYIAGLQQVWDQHKNVFAIQRKSSMCLSDRR